MTTPLARSLDELNHDYARHHTAKEDAFWASYMGLRQDADAARAELVEKENALKGFLQNPQRLATTRALLAQARTAASPEDRIALEGWVRTFESHVIESAEARALAAEIVEAEGRLARARGEMKLGYRHPDRGFEAASSVKLSVLMTNDPDERVRRAAWEGLRSIEECVLANGFLDIVKQRNRLGRMLGGSDYYDATVRRVEGMSKDEVFALLDELEEKTRDRARLAIDELRRRKGDDQVRPWSVRFLISGDVSKEMDPYFPFAESVARWGRSFAALGIDYRGAELVLDLVDRKGKYENGFMHGPVPAWRDRGTWRPARIQFTANAIPGMVGAGRRAIETLFHEGGHAAHFANNDMPAPCFSQEFAPSSVAFAETQSMFLDSLVSDADWLARYATNAAGAPMPLALIERGIESDQPYAAWTLRGMLTICYGEKAIYEIPDDELAPERVQAELRAVERRMMFLDEGAGRPVLAVPHLLAGESSAYYHGYVLAEMAVQQTRAFFLERDGHLVDNPRIGPDLRENYWREGNARRFGDFVRGLTGKPLSAAALAAAVSRSVDQARDEARARVAKLVSIPPHLGRVALDARIRIRHGNEEIASDEGSDFEGMARRFAQWIRARERGGA